VQGTTIKPVLGALGIALADEHESAGFEKLNLKLVDNIMRGKAKAMLCGGTVASPE